MSERCADWYIPTVEEPEQTRIQPRNCVACGQPIPLARLEALPHTDVCVYHSSEPARVGYMVVSHKTGAEFISLDPRDKEAIRRATRAHRRSR